MQNLRQGNQSVEEYFKDILMIRENIEEDCHATITKFLVGLNCEVVDVVELHHYVELEEMVHMTIKVEN